MREAIFAWLYYSGAVFLLLVAPYYVYERNKSQTAATMAFFIILVVTIQWYSTLKRLIWPSL